MRVDLRGILSLRARKLIGLACGRSCLGHGVFLRSSGVLASHSGFVSCCRTISTLQRTSRVVALPSTSLTLADEEVTHRMFSGDKRGKPTDLTVALTSKAVVTVPSWRVEQQWRYSLTTSVGLADLPSLELVYHSRGFSSGGGIGMNPGPLSISLFSVTIRIRQGSSLGLSDASTRFSNRDTNGTAHYLGKKGFPRGYLKHAVFIRLLFFGADF